MADLSTGMIVWWLTLCTVSVFNIAITIRFWKTHLENRSGLNETAYGLQRKLLYLATIFVLGCAFRAFLPRADTQRINLVNSWISSILVGRSVATIAELSFVIQWTIVLRALARGLKMPRLAAAAAVLIPAIVVAEVFSWLGVLSTSSYWHVLEESIWACCEIFLTIASAFMWMHYRGPTKTFLSWMTVCGAIYVLFMLTIDVPTYYSRWRLETATGKELTGFAEGFHNLAYSWTTTHAAKDWQGEFVWMLIYFSLAVWVSLAFTQAPLGRFSQDGASKHTV
ncbi:MAG: hypothetical protein C5B54_00005 [Acidobacteria bacterium]|nr:MAG: hypothetical protein C5B54_00005 [Acidobacteriota bacterium]